ncbi:MAG: serine/threonine protein kinase [Myxococcales bacterium]|nr:serine/threonine protein kinase [Myxococcales bacterium]
MISAMIGTTVGSYCVTEKVSIGGMGTVYKAEHVLIGKLAAVKVLHPELCNNRDIVNRFFNEAKATTQIKHPGIVEVFDFGYLPSGDAFIIMEFLEGMSLAQRLKSRGRMEEGEAAMLLKSMCSALGAAHAKGIVHRDLKPDNIFLVPDPEAASGERPKLLDFGIAKLTDLGPAGSGTKTGAVMGTPTYMSPEQCRGTGNIDLRADLYSLGCIFYELLCGRPPFIAEGAGELIGAHLLTQPDSPRKYAPAISAPSENLIMALLAKEPAQRPQTAKELGQRLTAIATNQGWITNTSPTGVTRESLSDLPDFRATSTPIPGTGASPSSSSTLDPGTSPQSATPVRHTPPSVAMDATLASLPGTESLASSTHPQRTISPTTLSGAASAILDVPRSRRGVWIAGLCAVVLVGGGVGFMAMRKSDSSSQPAKQPELAKVPQPEPVQAAPVIAPPAPIAPPVVAPTPTSAATPPTPVAAPTPVPDPKPDPKPVVVRPAVVKTPHVDKPKKPPQRPEAQKPPKPDKGKGSGHILIETDI